MRPATFSRMVIVVNSLGKPHPLLVPMIYPGQSCLHAVRRVVCCGMYFSEGTHLYIPYKTSGATRAIMPGAALMMP